MKTLGYATSCTLCLFLSAGSALADEPRAAQLFREGSNAYERGDYMIAARAFEEAHREDARGATMYNAALAWEAAGEKARAADAYQQSLGASDVPPEVASDARTRLTALEQQLGRLTITAPAGGDGQRCAPREGGDAGDGAFAAGQPGGQRALCGRHDRAAARGNQRGSGAIARLSIGADQTTAAFGERAAGPTVVPALPPPPPPAVEPARPATRRTWGFVALGGAVVFAGAATYLGLEALSARDEFDASQHRDADARDRAASLRLWTNVAWAGAAVSGGVGAWLVLSGSSRRDRGSARAAWLWAQGR